VCGTCNRAEDYAFVMAATHYFWNTRMGDTLQYLGGFRLGAETKNIECRFDEAVCRNNVCLVLLR
jgi:hypothetical protein